MSTPAPDPVPATSGRGSGDEPSGGNRKPRRHGGGRGNPDRPKHESQGKTGNIEQLGKHIYDVAANGPVDSFASTTQAIAIYVSSTLDRAGEYRTALVDLELPPVTVPTPPPDATNVLLNALFTEEVKAYGRAIEARKNNQGKIFGIIIGQCTKAMRDQIEACNGWSAVSSQSDVIGLLKMIRANSYSKQPKRDMSHSLLDAIREFY